MAKAITKSWTQLVFYLGDGNSPEDFTKAVCGFNTKAFSLASEMSETRVPDCDDPDLPAWIERNIKTLSASFRGGGVMDKNVFELYREWKMSGEARNCYVILPGQPGYFTGQFVSSQLDVTGNEDDGKLQISIQASSNGELAWYTGTVSP